MSSERQQQASRENGSKSHGPVSGAGKLNSSRNALKHGMLSGTVVLKGESTDRFLDLLTTLLEEFQPETPFEESLIESMAVVKWRQMRVWGMEKAGMEYQMRRQAEMSGSIATEDNATQAAIAFRTPSDDSRSLELINRYDSRYERQYLRTHRRFIEVRGGRTPPSTRPTTPPSAPTPAGPAAPGEVDISKGTPEVIANKVTDINRESAPPQARPTHLLTLQAARTMALFMFIRVHSWLNLVFPPPAKLHHAR